MFWCGPSLDAGGYGKMSRKCLEGLYNKGYKIQHDPFRVPDMRSTVEKSNVFQEITRNRVDKKAISVWGIMPQKLYPREGYKILYTMIETKGIHKSFAQKCNLVNEIWTPSVFCKESFAEAKIAPRVELVPLGVDVDLYKKQLLSEEQKSLFKINKKDFAFFSLFGWSLRKGYDILLRAYLKAFSSDDDVSLVIASRKNGNPSESAEIPVEIKKYIKLYSSAEKAPHILHINQAMPEEHIPMLFNMCQAYCLPSRGEGFSLTHAEAGACEMPVISSRACSMTDFLNDNNSFLVDIEGYGKNKNMKELSSYYQDMPFAILGEKAVDQLAGIMRDVYTNYESAQKRGERLRKDIVDNFTWEHTVDKIDKILKSR